MTTDTNNHEHNKSPLSNGVTIAELREKFVAGTYTPVDAVTDAFPVTPNCIIFHILLFIHRF